MGDFPVRDPPSAPVYDSVLSLSSPLSALLLLLLAFRSSERAMDVLEGGGIQTAFGAAKDRWKEGVLCMRVLVHRWEGGERGAR